jgi:hypothetical protein
LLGRLGPASLLPATEKLHHTKLLIGEGKNDDFTPGCQKRLYTLYVHFSVFAAAAMPYINGILQHGKSILLKIFPEPGIVFPVLNGFGWQIKEYKYPQDMILV